MPVSDKHLTSGDSLKGKLLLAMPHMEDVRFDRAVMLMLEHNAEGAMGLILNKSLKGVSLVDLMQQLEIEITAEQPITCPVLFGGPVEMGRGFILHSTDKLLPQSVLLSKDLAVTTLLELLQDIARGTGPQQMLFCLGYAGWTAGQLEDELKQNTWLHAPLDTNLIFNLPLDARWDAAMQLAGVNPDFLAAQTGHA